MKKFCQIPIHGILDLPRNKKDVPVSMTSVSTKARKCHLWEQRSNDSIGKREKGLTLHSWPIPEGYLGSWKHSWLGWWTWSTCWTSLKHKSQGTQLKTDVCMHCKKKKNTPTPSHTPQKKKSIPTNVAYTSGDKSLMCSTYLASKKDDSNKKISFSH